MNTFQTSEKQLTVETLLLFLQDLLKKDPTLKTVTISHSEMGTITPSHTVYVTGDSKPTLVLSGSV